MGRSWFRAAVPLLALVGACGGGGGATSATADAQGPDGGMKGAAAADTPRALSNCRREVAPLPRASVRRSFMPGYWREIGDQVIPSEMFALKTLLAGRKHKNGRLGAMTG